MRPSLPPYRFLQTYANPTYLKQLIQSLKRGVWFKIEKAYGDQIFALSYFRSENSKGILIKFMPSLREEKLYSNYFSYNMPA